MAILFDGGGTVTLAEVVHSESAPHRTWLAVAPTLRVACDYSARSDGVRDALLAPDVPLIIDHRSHASLRQLLEEGRQIVTF